MSASKACEIDVLKGALDLINYCEHFDFSGTECTNSCVFWRVYKATYGDDAMSCPFNLDSGIMEDLEQEMREEIWR